MLSGIGTEPDYTEAALAGMSSGSGAWLGGVEGGGRGVYLVLTFSLLWCSPKLARHVIKIIAIDLSRTSGTAVLSQ